jgi:hypothetical protein
MKDREEVLIAACNAVNADSAINELVDDWQAVDDPIEEPWHEMELRGTDFSVPEFRRGT